jgi:hypothetical protein
LEESGNPKLTPYLDSVGIPTIGVQLKGVGFEYFFEESSCLVAHALN